MEIKIFAQVEVPIDERYSRTDYVTITLGDEAIAEIAKAIQQINQKINQMPTCEGCGAEKVNGVVYAHFYPCPLGKYTTDENT